MKKLLLSLAVGAYSCCALAQVASVGTTDGVFDVSNLGAATYSIPIKLPAGVGGLVPNVSLNYNSQGGNGIAGFGWSLSATSAITRTGKSIYLDQKVKGIEFGTDGKLALDGNNLIATSGTYGSSATTYSTEMEGFKKIVADGASNSSTSTFSVTDENGWVYTYGAPSVATVTLSSGGSPLMWLLYQVEDLNGNKMQYDYNLALGEEPRIANISYGSAGSALANTVISFTYTTRTDENFTYISGGKLKQDYRLSAIIVKGRNSGESLVPIRTYTLTYAMDFYSHLIKVTEKGSEVSGSPEMLSPTEFTYGPTGAYASSVMHSEFDIKDHNNTFTTGDFNGDGKTDVMKFSTDIATRQYKMFLSNNGTDEFTLSSYGTLNIDASVAGTNNTLLPNQQANSMNIDYNGDGKDDFIYFQQYQDPSNPDLVKQKYWVYLSDGSSINPIAQIVSQVSDPSASTIIGRTVPVVGDFDGDGKTEVIAIPNSTDPLRRLGFLIGEKYNTYSTIHGYPAFGAKMLGNHTMLGINAVGGNKVFAIDYDGDGKNELLNIRDGISYIYELNVTFDEDSNPVLGEMPFTLISSGDVPLGYPTVWHHVQTGDFNGDRITDVLTWVSGAGWEIGYGTGNALFDIQPISFIAAAPNCGYYSVGDFRSVVVADYNGDGKSDIYDHSSPYCTPSYAPKLFYSKGNNQFSLESSLISTSIAGTSSSSSIVGDYNGDGKMEILTYNSIFSPLYIFSFHSNENRHEIAKITNGLGNITDVHYSPLPQNGVYTSGTTSYTYPFIKRTIPFQVVSKSTFDNNSTVGNDVTYAYSGLKFHALGKGLVGFDKVTKTDVARSRSVESSYLLNTTYAFPYLRSVIAKQGTTTVSSSYNNYEVYHYGNKRIFPYISSISSTDFIKQQNSLQEFTYTVGTGEINPLLIGKPRIITTYKGFTTPYIPPPAALEKTVQTNVFPASSVAFHLRSKPLSVTTATTRSGQPVYSRKQSFTYSTATGLLATIVSDPSTTNSVTNTFTYNSVGNLTQKATSSSGLSTRTEIYQYDPTNRFLISSYNSSFPAVKTTNTYDVITGWLTKTVEADGFTTNYTYDGFGRAKLVTDNNGGSVFTRYGWSDGHAYTTTAGASKYMVVTKSNTMDSAYTFYDRLGRVTRGASKGFGGTMIFVDDRYDGKGQLARRSNPYFQGSTLSNNTFGYDAYGRTINENRVGGNNTTYTYSTLTTGYEVTATNAAGQVKKTTTDRSGRVTKSEDEGGTLNYTYHSNGNVKETKLGTTTVQTTEYDTWGRKTKETDPNYGSYEYTYNAYGETTTMKDPKAQTYNYSYNVLGALGVKTGPEGTYTYTYNTTAGANCGKLTKIVGPEGTEESSFGMGNKVTWQKSTIGTEVLTTEYTYDAFGRTSTVKYPNGVRTQMGYNAIDGTLVALGKLNATGTLEATLCGTYGKNAFGQTTVFAQNITWDPGDIYYSPMTALSYTTAGLLTEQKSDVYSVGGITTNVRHYQYDFNSTTGNLRSRTNVKNSRIERFTFDDLNRLTLSQPEIISPPAMMVGNTITYSANGNIESKSDAGTFSYDIANRVSEIQPYSNIPAITQLVTYKPFNKVADITEGTWKAEFTYSPSGERNKMLLKEGGILKKTKYYGADYEKEIDAVTGSVRELCYVTGPDGHYIAIIEKKDGVEKTYYTLIDYLGSITHIMHNGVVLEERSYDAWGRYRNPTTWVPIAPTDVVSNFDRGYTGHEYLPKFGIINMNGRLYDPVMGRMFSADPYIMGANNTQGYNRYTYALNNPLTYTDPSGNIVLAPILIGAFIGMCANVMVNSSNIDNGWQFFGAAAAGGAAGALGAFIGGASIPFANTLGILGSSYVNSVGNSFTFGQNNLSLNFGFGSYNFSQDDFSYLGEKGNSTMENIGFTFGALANLQDGFAGLNGVEGEYRAETYDIQHARFRGKYESSKFDISVAHIDATNYKWTKSSDIGFLNNLDYARDWSARIARGKYHHHVSSGLSLKINNVNGKWLTEMSKRLGDGKSQGKGLWGLGKLKYGTTMFGCQSHVAHALLAVGVPTLPINFMPQILYGQLAIRQAGIYAAPMLTE